MLSVAHLSSHNGDSTLQGELLEQRACIQGSYILCMAGTNLFICSYLECYENLLYLQNEKLQKFQLVPQQWTIKTLQSWISRWFCQVPAPSCRPG